MTKLAKQENKLAVNPNAKDINSLAAYLAHKRPEIESLLTDGRGVERVIKTAMMAAMESPDIIGKCTAKSVYRSLMQSVIMGLSIGNGFGEAYLVRYGQNCTLAAGYIGWKKVACRSDGVDLIRASVVYENDHIEVTEHPPAVIHEPTFVDRGECIGALAVAYSMVDGKHVLYDFTFMPNEDLEKAREGSKSGVWNKWLDEMRKKTVTRRLCKQLPRNEALEKLTGLENNADNGIVNIPEPELDEEIIEGEIIETTAVELEVVVDEPKGPKKSKASKIKAGMAKPDDDAELEF